MEREKLLQGSLYMIIGFFFVAIYGAFLKAATNSIESILWGTFISYLTPCIIQYCCIAKKGVVFLKTKKYGSYAGRIIFGVLSTLLYISSIHYVSLLNATVLYSTTPLFIPIFAIFILKSKVPAKIWASLIIGFIGILFILRPDESILKRSGDLIGLSSGAIQALAFIFVKILTKTEPIRRINFYFFLFSALLLLPLVILFWEPHPFIDWIWAISAGIAGFFAQLFIVKAYQEAEASEVGAFQYASVVFSGLIGWIVWKQTPALFDLIGVLLIMIGGILAVTMFNKKHLKT